MLTSEMKAAGIVYFYDPDEHQHRPVTQNDVDKWTAWIASVGPLIRLHGDELLNRTVDAWVEARATNKPIEAIRLPGSEAAFSA